MILKGYSKKILIIIIFLVFSFPVKSETEKNAKAKKVLIVYQERVPKKVKFDGISAIANQISHFNVKIIELESKKYRSGMIHFYDSIFYIGYDKEKPPPEAFYEDVIKEKKRTICWIFEDITPLTERAGEELGFTVTPQEFGFNSINYNGLSFNRIGEDVFIININDRQKAKAHGSLFRKNEFVPYAVSSGNFWYVSDLPFFITSSSFVLCDLLHEILEEEHQHYKYAIIRIEDIHPMRDPKQIRAIGRIFRKYKTPFCFGVIPLYRNPGTTKKVSISDRKYLANALRYLQALGGTAILHGYTHQYKDEAGEGHEFWDKELDSPIPDDSEELIREKLNNGIEECLKNGIYPLAWETPHYGASQLDYRIFSEFFSTGIENLQLSDKSFGIVQNFPYFIKSKNGRWIVPENLGYLNYREGMTVEKMLENARRMLVVRDAVAVGFFHPYIDLEYLEELILGLKNLGFTFLDMRDLPNQVKSKEWLLFSGLPYFYGLNFINEIYYNWNLSHTKIIDLSRQGFQSFLLDRGFQKKSVSTNAKLISGEVIVKIPDVHKSIFVVHKIKKAPNQWDSFVEWWHKVILGKDTPSVSYMIMRLAMWGFFILTFIILVVMAFLFFMGVLFKEE